MLGIRILMVLWTMNCQEAETVVSASKKFWLAMKQNLAINV